jgi:beta-glucosidase
MYLLSVFAMGAVLAISAHTALAASQAASKAPASPVDRYVLPNCEAATAGKILGHPYAIERYQEIKDQMKNVDRSKVGLVLLGDSITERWKHSDDIWKRYFGRYNPVNHGVGCDTTMGVLFRIADGCFAGMNPKVFVLNIGTNNICESRHSPEDTAAGILAIVKKLRGTFPKTKILVMGIFPRGDNEGKTNFRWDKAPRANSIVQRYADNQNVYFMDIGERFLQPDGLPLPATYADGVHLGRGGLDIWGAAIERTLAEMMAESPRKIPAVTCSVEFEAGRMGATGAMNVTITPQVSILDGMKVEITVPVGFMLDRTKPQLPGVQASQKRPATTDSVASVLSPQAVIAIRKPHTQGRPATFSLSNVTTPTFVGDFAGVLVEIRAANGVLLARGQSGFISVR